MKEIAALLIVLAVTGCAGGPGVETGQVKRVLGPTKLEVPSNITDPESVETDFTLIGITAPDKKDRQLVRAFFGVLAEEWVDDWIVDRDVAVKHPLEKNGKPVRNSGWIWDPREDVFLHRELVRLGFATVEEASIPEEYAAERETLKGLEAEAKAAGRGMWRERIPSNHEIRKMVDAANGPWGRILRSASDPTNLSAQANPLLGGTTPPEITRPEVTQPDVAQPDVPQPVRPVRPVRPDAIPPVRPPAGGKKARDVVLELDNEVRAVRRDHLNWLLSDAATRKAGRTGVWNRLRNAKIRLMDVLDDRDDLDATQRRYLTDLRADLNRLMKEMTR